MFAFEVSREQCGGSGIEAHGFAAVEFGADGVEIHEPALEQRPRHRLQRRVHPPVQLDLVVQRPEDSRDGFLFGDGREWIFERLRAYPENKVNEEAAAVSA